MRVATFARRALLVVRPTSMAARLPALAPLELPEVVETGRVLGKGAYGEVVEVKVLGMK